MISLHITVYALDDDRFLVYAGNADGIIEDVTDQYEVIAISGEHNGFAVVRREVEDDDDDGNQD